MVALSACPGRREVVVWASYWRRGRSGNAIGLTKVARQSAVRAQHGPYCSHTEERFSDIWRPHGDLVDYLGHHGRSMVAVLCDGGFSAAQYTPTSVVFCLVIMVILSILSGIIVCIYLYLLGLLCWHCIAIICLGGIELALKDMGKISQYQPLQSTIEPIPTA